MRIHNPEEAIRHSIGYLSDDRRRSGLAGLLGVGSNLTLASLPQFSRVGVLKSRDERRSAAAMVGAIRHLADTGPDPAVWHLTVGGTLPRPGGGPDSQEVALGRAGRSPRQRNRSARDERR